MAKRKMKKRTNIGGQNTTPFLLHKWHRSCYTWYTSNDKACQRKGGGIVTTANTIFVTGKFING